MLPIRTLPRLPVQDAVVVRAGSRRSHARGLVSAERAHRNSGERSLGHGGPGILAGPAHALLAVRLQRSGVYQLHRPLCQL